MVLPFKTPKPAKWLFRKLKIKGLIAHAPEMPARTFAVTNLGTRPAVQAFQFKNLEIGFIRVHAESRYGIAPNAIDFLLKSRPDVHQTGIVGEKRLALFHQRSRLVQVVLAAGIVNGCWLVVVGCWILEMLYN